MSARSQADQLVKYPGWRRAFCPSVFIDQIAESWSELLVQLCAAGAQFQTGRGEYLAEPCHLWNGGRGWSA